MNTVDEMQDALEKETALSQRAHHHNSYSDEHEAYAAARVTQFVYQVVLYQSVYFCPKLVADASSIFHCSPTRTRTSLRLISTQIHWKMT